MRHASVKIALFCKLATGKHISSKTISHIRKAIEVEIFVVSSYPQYYHAFATLHFQDFWSIWEDEQNTSSYYGPKEKN